MIRRALFVPTVMGGAFNPENVAGIVYRWVADDIAGNDGDAIGTWTDRIASKALSQATADNKPLLKKAANGIGGKNALLFDGTNDYMTTGVFTDLSQPNTIFVVAKNGRADYANNAVILDSVIGTSTKRHAFFIRAGSPDKWEIYAGTELFNTSTSGLATPFYATLIFNGANSFIRINGAQVDTGNAGTQAMGSLQIGIYLTSPSGPYDGLIAELIIYNAALSDANRDAVEAYLASYYGL